MSPAAVWLAVVTTAALIVIIAVSLLGGLEFVIKATQRLVDPAVHP